MQKKVRTGRTTYYYYYYFPFPFSFGNLSFPGYLKKACPAKTGFLHLLKTERLNVYFFGPPVVTGGFSFAIASMWDSRLSVIVCPAMLQLCLKRSLRAGSMLIKSSVFFSIALKF